MEMTRGRFFLALLSPLLAGKMSRGTLRPIRDSRAGEGKGERLQRVPGTVNQWQRQVRISWTDHEGQDHEVITNYPIRHTIISNVPPGHTQVYRWSWV